MTRSSKLPNGRRKGSVASPETGRSEMPRSSLVRPALCAVRASSTSLSRLPTRASSKIWRSHWAESYSRNHCRNAASSARLSVWIPPFEFVDFCHTLMPLLVFGERVEQQLQTVELPGLTFHLIAWALGDKNCPPSYLEGSEAETWKEWAVLQNKEKP